VNVEALSKEWLQENKKLPANIITSEGNLFLRKGVTLSFDVVRELCMHSLEGLFVTEQEAKRERFPEHDRGDSFKAVPDPVLQEWRPKFAKLSSAFHLEMGRVSAAHINRWLSLRQLQIRPAEHPLVKDIHNIAVKDRVWESRQSIRKAYKQTVKRVEKLYNRLYQGELSDVSEAYELVDVLMGALIQDRLLLLAQASTFRTRGEYLFNHVVDVAIVAMDMASLRYGVDVVRMIGLAALLADVGMMYIDPKVRSKTEKLDNEDLTLIRQHPILSLSVLEKYPGMPPLALVVALQGHERMNGYGYPYQLKQDKIQYFAALYGVADIYQALIRSKTYKVAHTPYEGMETLLRMTKAGFLHAEILRDLLKLLGLFPVGSFVRLNTGEVARVIEAPRQGSSNQPVIAVVMDAQGKMLEAETMVQLDLAMKRGVLITEALDGLQIGLSELSGF
jgi:HD-GYP domain-containing protein (c-di-GMP phosphodiesterase class II)